MQRGAAVRISHPGRIAGPARGPDLDAPRTTWIPAQRYALARMTIAQFFAHIGARLHA
jgi:hypothetical protein